VKDLTRGNIYKTFFLFGLPLALSGLLTQSFHIVDTMIAGKFLGDIGLAAMGAVAPFITFCSSVFWGFGAGCGTDIVCLPAGHKCEEGHAGGGG
jgi:Na+-driven multidrug efflux pump